MVVGTTTVRMKIQLNRLRFLGGSVQTGGGEANWCGRKRCTSGAVTAASAVAATEVVFPVAGRFSLVAAAGMAWAAPESAGPVDGVGRLGSLVFGFFLSDSTALFQSF